MGTTPTLNPVTLPTLEVVTTSAIPGKTALEEEKLRLEIKQLKRRWRPETYFSGIITLCIGIGSIIVAYLSGVFEVNNKILEIRRHDLSEEVRQFENKKDTLSKENNQLRESVKLLQQQRDQLQHQKNDLSTETKLVELKTTIAAVGRLSGFMVDLNNEFVKRVFYLVEHDGPHSPEVEYVASLIANSKYNSIMLATLCVPLSRITHDPRWERKLFALATDYTQGMVKEMLKRLGDQRVPISQDLLYNAVPPVFLEALKAVATVSERARYIKSIRDAFGSDKFLDDSKTSPFFPGFATSGVFRAQVAFLLASNDPEANIEYPDIWLDLLDYLANWTSKTAFYANQSSNLTLMGQLSPQAAAVHAIRLAHDAKFANQNPEVTFELLDKACVYPADFPLKCDVVPPRQFSLITFNVKIQKDQVDADYMWLVNHNAIQYLFSPRLLTRLRSSPNLLRKAVRKKWIADEEASDSH